MAAKRLETAVPANEFQALAALFFFVKVGDSQSIDWPEYQSVAHANSFFSCTKSGFEC